MAVIAAMAAVVLTASAAPEAASAAAPSTSGAPSARGPTPPTGDDKGQLAARKSRKPLSASLRLGEVAAAFGIAQGADLRVALLQDGVVG